MVAFWVMGEMKTVDLNDKRLNNRLLEVLSQLGGRPTAGILQPHTEATRQRLARQAVVVPAQDTTEVGCASLSRAQRAAIPIEEKESYRWVETLRRSGEEQHERRYVVSSTLSQTQ